ncbi:helix-turn-helix transcriptional regulator [Streptomyces erythrochromogenes]|uniref:helix-turn-helix transcriptional regulator n=1 Tax=Streptomyces erythrochromogenes TaxID=285574 RepID=UPI0036A03BCF
MATELADNVRKYRRRAGMSQEELAYAAGVSPGTVRKVEQGGTVRMETVATATTTDSGAQPRTMADAKTPPHLHKSS